MKWIGIAVWFLSAIASCYGKAIILEKGEAEYEPLSNTLEVFEDQTTKVTLDDILKHPERYPFTEGGAKEQFSHHVAHNYWIRFKIYNKSGIYSKWVLEILDSRFSEVVFYTPDFGDTLRYAQSTTGLQYNFNEREYQHKNFVFDIPLGSTLKEESPYYYIKIRPGTIGSFLFKIRKGVIVFNF